MNKLSRSIGVVLRTSASAGFCSAEKVYTRGNSGVKASQGGGSDFDWQGAESGVESNRGIADGGTSIMTDGDHCFVGMFTQLLSRRRNGLTSDVEEEMGLSEDGLRAKREAHGHQLRS